MGHYYKDLIVWQKAMDMVTLVYRATQRFPREELYGLTSQLRRSAVSVPSNIAEGQGRLSRKEFRQFLGQARGSLLEVETQILIASRLNYLDAEQLIQLTEASGEVSRLLHRLLQSISEVAAPAREPETRN